MNGRKATESSCLLGAILFLLCGSLSASPITGDPTFLLPNSATNTPVTFQDKRPVANGYSLNAMYNDGDEQWYRTGAVLSNTPGSLSWGVGSNYANVYASPGSFEAKAKHTVTTDGTQGYYTYGSSQVWNWYVLAGSPGEVTLSADILMQGQAFANNASGGNAGTIFGTSLGFLSSPNDLTQDYVIGLTGAVNWSAGFSSNNTVDIDVVWDSGTDTHDVNLIIRSQPFTVTVGVPFRLSLLTSTQGFAGSGGVGLAWSDFFDPRLATAADFVSIPQLKPEGFAVVSTDAAGNVTYENLGPGYSISRIPEPATLALFGLGLAGLLFARKRTTLA